MSSEDVNIRMNGKPSDTGESTKPTAGMGHTLMDGINASAYAGGTTLMGLADGYPNMFYPSGTTGAGTATTGPMSFPNFGSTDAPWATPAFDPTIMGAPGYNDTGLVTQPPLQSPHFYFPSNDSFWSSDLLTSPFFMNYSFLGGGVPTVDQPQQQQQVQQQEQQLQPSVTSSVIASSNPESNSVDSLGQQFSTALTVNGTSLGVGLQDSLDNSNNSSTVVVESPETSSTSHTSSAPAPDKPKSWAAVAKLPPKPPQPKPVTVVPSSSDMKNSAKPPPQLPPTKQPNMDMKRRPNTGGTTAPVISSRPRQQPAPQGGLIVSPGSNIPEIVHKLHAENNYNPKEFSFSLTNARYFVIKSYAEDDIHRSIKYSIWTSTEHGNKRLDSAYREQKGRGNIYLFFSVNGSGHFCGVAQMASEVNFHVVTGVWSQDKWKGRFSVKWLYVKDVPNNALRHIRLENNENKPVTNSRDTQEIPVDKAKLVMKIVHDWRATSSIFDDFGHYEEKELEDKKVSK